MPANYTLQVLFTLSLLAITLFVVVKLSEKWQLKKYSGEIQIKDRRHIDANSALVIASIRSKDYLIGISGKDLKLLDTL